MREFFAPADAPLWFNRVFRSVKEALSDIWPTPLRLKDYATADLPAAADWTQGLVYDSTTDTVKVSDGSTWDELTAELADGDYGDVDVGGSGTTLTVESATPASGTFAVTGHQTLGGDLTLATGFAIYNAEGVVFQPAAGYVFFDFRDAGGTQRQAIYGGNADQTLWFDSNKIILNNLAESKVFIYADETTVQLKYQNATKLATSADGISVAGDVDLSGVLEVDSVQVVNNRKTGWSVDTGTAKRTANATYAAGATLTFTDPPTAAEMAALATRIAAIEAALQDSSQTTKALKDDLHSTAGHGLIGT
jgi:hypothetical protein